MGKLNIGKLNIGDRVYCEYYNEYGVIDDKMYSEKKGVWLYTVQLNNGKTRMLADEDLDLVKGKEYRFDVFQAENVMVAVMYEIDGDTEREIKRYHGHIMHDGIIGIAQAASYAMKKIYISMNDGKFVEREDI